VPIIKAIGNKIVASIVSLIIGKPISDAECGFRSLSAEAASRLQLLGRFTFTHDMLVDLASKHFKIVEVPVSVRYFKNRNSRAIGNMIVYGCGVIVMLLAKSIFQYLTPFEGIRTGSRFREMSTHNNSKQRRFNCSSSPTHDIDPDIHKLD
jgi:hypothetical protein